MSTAAVNTHHKRSVLRQYKSFIEEQWKVAAPYIERLVGGTQRYDRLRAVFNRMPRHIGSESPGKSRQKFASAGVSLPALPSKKYVTLIKKGAVSAQSTINLYRVPAGYTYEQGSNMSCEDGSAPCLIGKFQDSALGIKQAAKSAVNSITGSDLLVASVLAADNNMLDASYVHEIATLECDVSMSAWMHATLKVSDSDATTREWNGLLLILEGVFWADGVSANGQSRLVGLMWLIDRHRELFTSQTSRTVPVLEVDGGEQLVRQLVAIGPELRVSHLGQELNLCLCDIQRTMFHLQPTPDGMARAFAIDIAYHSFDGKALATMLGLSYGTAPRSIRAFHSYIESRHCPTNCFPDGKILLHRVYHELKHDF